MKDQAMKTATETMSESDRTRRLWRGVQHLLHSLKKFARAVPVDESASMPDYNIEWAVEIDGSPAKAIIETMKAHPELWMQAVPDGVILVQKKALQLTGVVDSHIQFLEGYAHNEIGIQSDRMQEKWRQDDEKRRLSTVG